jgi:DNA-binding GntR family transcriptional regulator
MKRTLDDGNDLADADDGPRETDAIEVHDRLRTAILRGDLRSDTPISQVQLAKQYGTSRTPLREALRMLEREGLIRSFPQRRAEVVPVSTEDVEEIYAMRIVLEALAIRITVPLLTDGELTRLAERLARMDDTAVPADFELWESEHQAFHGGLIVHAGHRLVTTARQLSDHAERYRRVYLSEPRTWYPAAQDHHAIWEACNARDSVRAGDLIAQHFARTALTVIALVAPEHEPRLVREALRSVTGGRAPSADAQKERPKPDDR